MGFIREIREIYNYFRVAKNSSEITFFSENGIYYQNYRGTIEAILDKSDFKILYITSDPKDPVWNLNDDRIICFYIKKLIPFIFPFINSKTLIMTMTDLDKYHVKRSTNPVNHIYMFHAINSIHLQYNKGAFDCYDTIFCVGPHHIEEIRKTEEIYNIPPKKLVEVGYSWLEDIELHYQQTLSNDNKILIAPSWNDGNILETYIDTILEKLLPLNYEIVVRPHPEFIKRYYSRVKELKQMNKRYSNLVIETNSASFDNILESALLITDWSGIAIEFAWGMGKPVIFINTPKKIHNQDFETIGILPLEDRIRNQIGTIINQSDVAKIDYVIEKEIRNKEKNKDMIMKLRNNYIFNWGESSNVAANYIIKYCNEN